MRAAGLLLAVLASCSAPAPVAPQAEAPAPVCIRPVSVSSRDFLSPTTLAEIRRVNRDLRRLCAGG